MKLIVTKTKQKDNYISYTPIFFFVTSFLILFLGTKSSPYYIYNNWCDANSYFSVGKAMFNGLAPYKDIFDQKGMYLYFLYGLCYLVSHTTFIGVFIMELIIGFIDIWGLFKILKTHLSESLSLFLAPISFAIIVSSYSFYMGGSAEEFCLPLYIWGLYLILDYCKKVSSDNKYVMPNKILITGGVLAGLVANIKFTGLGFFFGWMAYIFFIIVLVQKQLVKALQSCLWFLLGMFIPFIPWIIYFDLKCDLYWWYWGYVDINVFSYSNLGADGPGIFERIYNLAKIALWTLQDNPVWFILLIIGVGYSIFRLRVKSYERLLIVVLLGFLFLGIYIGGSRLPYYALPLSVFNVIGLLPMGLGLEKIIKKITNPSWISSSVSIVLSAIISITVMYSLSMNIKDHNLKKEDHYLTKFTEIIKESRIENPTLLNINCLDAGLYTTADIIPNCQWFQTQTINSNIPYNAQDKYISDGLTDFVIASKYYPVHIEDNYKLVSELPWSQEGYDIVYYLFQKK